MFINCVFWTYMIFSSIGNCRFGPLLSSGFEIGSLRSTVGHFMVIFRFYTFLYFPDFPYSIFSRFLRFFFELSFDFKISFFWSQISRSTHLKSIFDKFFVTTNKVILLYFWYQNHCFCDQRSQISSSKTYLWAIFFR